MLDSRVDGIEAGPLNEPTDLQAYRWFGIVTRVTDASMLDSRLDGTEAKSLNGSASSSMRWH